MNSKLHKIELTKLLVHLKLLSNRNRTREEYMPPAPRNLFPSLTWGCLSSRWRSGQMSVSAENTTLCLAAETSSAALSDQKKRSRHSCGKPKHKQSLLSMINTDCWDSTDKSAYYRYNYDGHNYLSTKRMTLFSSCMSSRADFSRRTFCPPPGGDM